VEAFPGIKRQDDKQTTDLPVVLRLGMRGALPLPPFIPSRLAHRATLPLIFLLYKALKFLLLFWLFLIFMLTHLIINSVFSEVRKFEVRKSVRHHTIQTIQPTRCDSFTSLLVDVYAWLNMFLASPRPSSVAYGCTRNL
jgi:hypothetical protein